MLVCYQGYQRSHDLVRRYAKPRAGACGPWSLFAVNLPESLASIALALAFASHNGRSRFWASRSPWKGQGLYVRNFRQAAAGKSVVVWCGCAVGIAEEHGGFEIRPSGDRWIGDRDQDKRIASRLHEMLYIPPTHISLSNACPPSHPCPQRTTPTLPPKSPPQARPPK